jgi:hypothetical protein
MTATVTGSFIDSSDSTAIAAAITTLGVAGNLVIVVPTTGNSVWLGKCIIT